MVEDESRSGALEAPEAGAPGDEPARTGSVSPGPTRRDRLPWIVAAIALLIALAAVVVATVLVIDARRPAAELAAVEETAGRFALELTTWDASDGMADTRESLREAGTETFAADVDQLFGGTDDLATLEEIGARSTGEVRDVFVQSLDGEDAEALVVVVQRVTTEVTDGEEVSLRYARLGLRRDGDRWRVDEVELVVDALEQTAGRPDPTQLPGFGDDGPADEEEEEEETP